MTLLQPHLGDSRRQKLRNSPFCPTPLFRLQLVKDGEDFLLKKRTLKIHRVLNPIKTSPFVVPTTIRKDAPTGNAPYGGNSSQSSNQSFSSGMRKSNNRGLRGHFRPHSRGQWCGNPSPNDSLQASLSPPFFQKRLASKQMFRQRVQHYHQ